MKSYYLSFLTIVLLLLMHITTACSPTVSVRGIKPQETVMVDTAFQSKLATVPSTPAYTCGAWSSSNGPHPFGTITIYAKLTKDVTGIPGASAQAVVNFKYGSQPLSERPVSDRGGYVSFSLPLQGRQPRLEAATVDVSFLVNGKTIKCSQAFFTPL